jgi:hypothetical protein
MKVKNSILGVVWKRQGSDLFTHWGDIVSEKANSTNFIGESS